MRHLGLIIVLGWLGLASSRLSAQDAAAEPAEQRYDRALDRALSAHESGDYLTAETAIREAHELAPSARTLRGLGVILYAQGRYVEAVEPLEAARSHAAKPLSPELPPHGPRLGARGVHFAENTLCKQRVH